MSISHKTSNIFDTLSSGVNIFNLFVPTNGALRSVPTVPGCNAIATPPLLLYKIYINTIYHHSIYIPFHFYTKRFYKHIECCFRHSIGIPSSKPIYSFTVNGLYDTK